MSGDLLRMAAGLVVLVVGAELLVRGAVSLATRFRVSPLIIGLTVVAFGTSTPEIAVSVGASMSGQGGVALGNVVGSNVFNILVILGLSAVVAPLRVRSQVVRQDVPLMLAAVALPVALGADGSLSRMDGSVLLLSLAAYLVLLARLARRAREKDPTEGVAVALPVPLAVILGLGGLLLLGFGSELLVSGATAVARGLGVSELVIGLTIVAVGTSLPELATSLMATRRDERDLAVGNVVGSNIFNALAVLGAGAAVGSIEVPVGVLMLDFPVMIAVCLACLPVFLSGANINRLEGAVFLGYYLLYVTFLGLHTSDHALHDEFGIAVVGVILPLTLAVGGALYIRGRREEPEATG